MTASGWAEESRAQSNDGAEIEREAVNNGPIPVGEAIVTGAGSLRAKWVIHAAVMDQALATDGNKIRLAVRNALRRASELRARSIALPALGTGVGGFSVDTAARIMVEEAARHADLHQGPTSIQFVLFSDSSKAAFDSAISELAEKHMR